MLSVKTLDKIIEYSFYSLFLLIPLVMTPWNFELFEYNKMMLVYALTVIIVGAWIIKMFAGNFPARLKRTPFDIPLILFFVFQFLSFLVSIDKHTSIFGYYSRFHGGLLSTISYLLLYYALVSNFDKQKIKNSLLVILFSGFLVSCYGILQHFGIDAKYWVQDVQNRVFSTLGQPNWLAAWLAAIAPVSLALSLKLKIENKILKTQSKNSQILNSLIFIFYFVSFIFYLFCLIFTKSRSGIPAAGFSLLIFLAFLTLLKIKQLKKQILIPLVSLSFLGFLIIGFLGLKFLFRNPSQDLAYIFDLSDKVTIPMHRVQDPGSDSGDIRKVVWRGAYKIFQAYPVLGTGPETFAYAYYRYRPIEHNYLSEWDFLYNKAHNEYFNFLATTGILGLGSYLLFIGWVIVWNIKKIFNFKFLIFNQTLNSKIENNALYTMHFALFSGWLSILITNFLGFSVVPIALLFFLFPAFSYLLSLPDNPPVNQKPVLHSGSATTIWPPVVSIVVLCSMFYVLCCLARYWQADFYYAKGYRLERQSSYVDAYQTLQKAISLNSGEPVYHDELAYTASALAVLASQEKENQLTSQFINTALFESNLALEISPKNINFWRTKARIFYNLAKIDPDYLNQALETLNIASTMAPTDAKILYNKGIVYYQLNQIPLALETLNKTLELKPEYPEVQNAIKAITEQ